MDVYAFPDPAAARAVAVRSGGMLPAPPQRS